LGALLVYSITSRESFEDCETWLEEVVQHADPGILIMLVGNKTDLVAQRSVTPEEGLAFAQRNKLSFIETSAKDNTNVGEAFERLIREIYLQLHAPRPPDPDSAASADDSTRAPRGMVIQPTPAADNEDEARKKVDGGCKC